MFGGVSNLKSGQINGTQWKENFLFNINNSILKKLSITKSVFSAEVQCSNLTLALKLYTNSLYLTLVVSLKLF